MSALLLIVVWVIPVKFEPSPENDVAVKAPVAELKAKLVPVCGVKSPVVAWTNNGKQVVSLDWSVAVTLVAVTSVMFDPSPYNVSA